MTPRALRSSSPIGFMPLIRPGDLIFTAIVLQYRMIKGTTIEGAVAAIRGSTAGHARSLFGHDVGQVAARVFGHASIAEHLLASNTLFGVYSRGMPQDTAAAWAQQLLDGDFHSSSRVLGITGFDHVTLCSHRLRSCSACIDADHAFRGFAAWRVLHQVVALDRCPEHGLSLVEEGEPSGGGHHRLWTMHLPGENRGLTKSGVEECIPVSDGYAGYLKLWPRVFAGDVQAIQPAQWIPLTSGILARDIGLQDAQEALETEIEQSWELPLHEIASRLALAGGSSFVHQELALNTRPKDIARRMVIYAAAERLGLIPGAIETPIQSEMKLNLPLPKDANNEVSAPIGPREELSKLAINRGLPLAISKILTTDVSSGRVAGIIGMSRETVRLFVGTLPMRLLDDLALLHDWSDTSWLKMELARRKSRITDTN